MNTYTIDELDREEIEFLPPRVVMTTSCNNYCPPPPCGSRCAPVLQVSVNIRLGCLFTGNADVRA